MASRTDSAIATAPAAALACLPPALRAVVMDFDGVLTDNRVFVDATGQEGVFCHRGDSLGLDMLKKQGIDLLVISKERAPVVAARCKKLKIDCLSGIDDKLAALTRHAAARGWPLESVIYVGNDVNDRDCLTAVGCGVVVADAHPDVLGIAKLRLRLPGGHGAVRELCDYILLALRRP